MNASVSYICNGFHWTIPGFLDTLEYIMCLGVKILLETLAVLVTTPWNIGKV